MKDDRKTDAELRMEIRAEMEEEQRRAQLRLELEEEQQAERERLRKQQEALELDEKEGIEAVRSESRKNAAGWAAILAVLAVVVFGYQEAMKSTEQRLEEDRIRKSEQRAENQRAIHFRFRSMCENRLRDSAEWGVESIDWETYPSEKGMAYIKNGFGAARRTPIRCVAGAVFIDR